MIKVVVTGAECSGKSTLAVMLSDHYNAPLVIEYARDYLSHSNGQYNYNDLPKIARGQLRSEQEVIRSKAPILICDTGMLVMKIWSEFKYGRCHPKIGHLYDEYTCDLFILPHYDVAYKADSLRENQNERPELYQLYLAEIKSSDFKHLLVAGSKDERLKKSVESIDSIIKDRAC